MFVVGVVTFVVGVRLMAQGLRNHQVPELAFGTAFLSGSLGTVGAQLGQRLWWTGGDDFATTMNAICFAIQVVGTFALFLSTWRIYRPNDAWAFFLAAFGAALAALAWVIRWMDGDFALNALETPGIAVFHAVRITVFAWAAIESLHYHEKMKKRMALGLADPVVTQQIYMWGVSAVAAAAVSVTIVTSVFGLGRHPLEVPEALALLVLLSLVLSACMWCAFFPPGALKRWATNRTL
jgi:hypothetical protein